MTRFTLVITLCVGAGLGFLAGVAVTSAHGGPEGLTPDQVVAKAGLTSITRQRLGEYAIAELGTTLLKGDLRDLAIVEEAARLHNVKVSPVEVKARVDEAEKFAKESGAENRMANIPRWLLEDRMRSVMLAEKMMGLTIGENEAKDYYAKNANIFFKPATMKLICIANTDEKKMGTAYQLLREGVDPLKVAAEYNMDARLREMKGQVGWYARSSMSPVIAEKVFEAHDGKPLNPGEFTEILTHEGDDANKETSFFKQYIIFFVQEYRDPVTPKFEDVREAAVFYARSTKYMENAAEWFKQREPQIPYSITGNLFDAAAPLQAVPSRVRTDAAPAAQ